MAVGVGLWVGRGDGVELDPDTDGCVVEGPVVAEDGPGVNRLWPTPDDDGPPPHAAIATQHTAKAPNTARLAERRWTATRTTVTP